jgi:hypothetical protein
MLLAGIYILMIYKIPSPPRNLVVPSHFLPKTGKFGPIRQKHPQNKVCRARRDRRVTMRVTRETRVEHNKPISTLPEFKTLMVFIYGTIHCEVANSFPPAGLAPVSDGATLKPQTACHRRTAPFWNAVEATIAQSAMEDH